MSPQLYTEGNVLALSAWFLNPHTKGSVEAGSAAVTVVDADGLSTSDPVLLEGAGAEGGDLVTTVASVSGNVVTVAAAAQTTVKLGRFGKRVDPASVTFRVKQPPRAGGSVDVFTDMDVEVTNPAVGEWRLDYTPASHGTYRWRAEGTGGAAGAEEDSFVVARSEIV